jgi:tRNA pseudouridine55 synthase
MDGVVVVDKPSGWTSHDVVAKMRRIAQTKRIGHLGTLDPMATGVLPLVIERATRLAQFYTQSEKVYEGTIQFGYATDTYDAEGVSQGEVRSVTPDPTELVAALERFHGEIDQVPPPVSAKKIGGVPAYKLARRNEPVELKSVRVTIHELDVLECSGASVSIRMRCSAGTYVRSLAHDLGKALGCGAFLSKLRRVRSGDFTLEQSHTLADLQAAAEEGRFEEFVIPASRLLPQFPMERLDAVTAGHVRQGRDFRVSPFDVPKNAPFVRALSMQGDLIAIGEAKLPHLYHPVVVLN